MEALMLAVGFAAGIFVGMVMTTILSSGHAQDSYDRGYKHGKRDRS